MTASAQEWARKLANTCEFEHRPHNQVFNWSSMYLHLYLSCYYYYCLNTDPITSGRAMLELRTSLEAVSGIHRYCYLEFGIWYLMIFVIGIHRYWYPQVFGIWYLVFVFGI